ncbi:MAG: lamin tail domain-containing protein [Gammaproteobacteria bacterium]
MPEKRMLLKALAIVSLLLATSMGAAAPNGIVISQFVTRGPTGGNDEFVELYNTSSSAVDIGGWQMQGCSSGSPGTASNRVVVTTGFVLEPGRYYLFTNSGSAPNYSLGVPGDQTYTTGFTDFTTTNFSGIRLLDAAGTPQDGVGSPQSPCREGAGITTPAVNGASNAFVRLNGGTQDTDGNADDFAGPGAANPHKAPSGNYVYNFVRNSRGSLLIRPTIDSTGAIV